MKKLLLAVLLSVLPLALLGQSEGAGTDARPCVQGTEASGNCWTVINFGNGQRYVGFVIDGKPQGEGILYYANGILDKAGVWESGKLVNHSKLSKSKYPFFDSSIPEYWRGKNYDETERPNLTAERKNGEAERYRPPAQKIAFCVQTVRVETRGTTFPSISVPYCQDACNKTYSDRMCDEVGGSKWRVQASSPKTSPPNSQYFAGMGTCSCVGQEYVLNEIKETRPPVAIPAPTSSVQADSREAELAKREKALAERERALLEAENKLLREELEAERKKKK